MIIITVPGSSNSIKLEKYIREQFPKLPSSALHKALRRKDIRINGQRITENVWIQSGDEITLYIQDALLYGTNTPQNEITAAHPFTVLYEDQYILLVDKKPGISVLRDKFETEECLTDQVIHYTKQQLQTDPSIDNPAEKPFTTAPCHRLDHYTGGIVLFAKTKEAYELLLDKIKQREIQKYYQCIVKGHPNPPEATLTHYLIKDAEHAQVQIQNYPIKGARSIITHYKVLSCDKQISQLEVELITGRTHQIRAHLAYIGHPIVGDDKYGDRSFNKAMGARYQALWAYKIRFNFQDGGILNYLKDQTFTSPTIRFKVKGCENMEINPTNHS